MSGDHYGGSGLPPERPRRRDAASERYGDVLYDDDATIGLGLGIAVCLGGAGLLIFAVVAYIALTGGV